MRIPIRLRSAATAWVVVASTGCQDVTNVQPETFSGTTTYYQTPDQMERAIFGAYSGLQVTYGGAATGPMWLLAEMRSDNTTYEFNVQNRSTSPQETIDTFVTSASENSPTKCSPVASVFSSTSRARFTFTSAESAAVGLRFAGSSLFVAVHHSVDAG